MTERGLNSPMLAKELGVNRSNITRYLRAEQAPYFALFVRLVDYFEVSADYMLGLLEFPLEERRYNKAPLFSERLRYVMENTGTTQYGIEKVLGISGSVMYRWLHNQSVLTVESLVKLSEYMECSVDYLIGRGN